VIIVTDILSRTFSELSQLIVQILDTACEPPFGELRDNVQCSSLAHWKARIVDFLLGLIELFFARCYGWGATNENRSKIGDFAPTRSVWSKISGRMGCSPTSHFCAVSSANECLTTLSLTVFTQRNFVADFLQVKWDFTPKTAVLRFEPPLGA